MEQQEEQEERPTPKRRVLARVAPLVGLNLLATASYGIMATVLPILMTQYYAHGTELDCQVSTQEEVCVEGSKRAAWVSSVFAAIGSGLLVFSSPLLGHASDVFGRKVFLMASQVLNLITALAALYFTLSGKGITLYFVLSLFNTAIGTDGVANAAAADCAGPTNRSSAFGFVFVATIIGFTMSTIVTGIATSVDSLYTGVGIGVARVVWVIFAVKETLPAESRSDDTLRAVGNPLASLAILTRTKFYIILTCLGILSSFAFTGLLTVQIYYFNVIMEFQQKDIAWFLLISGLVAILAQGLLLQPLVDRVGERGVVVTSFSNNVVMAIAFIFIGGYYPRKWITFATIPVGILSYLAIPALLSLATSNVAEKDQGRIQGAMYGARSVADALGSLAYGHVYGTIDPASAVSRMGPYILTGVVYMAGAVLAVWLPPPDKTERLTAISKSRTESVSGFDMAFLPMPSSAKSVELKVMDEVGAVV